MTKLTILSAAALAAAFTFTACKKDKKEGKTETTDTMAADKPAEGTAPTEPAPTPTEATPTPTEPPAPARPASVTDEHVKTADEFVSAIVATAAAAEGAKADCKAMAKALAAETTKVKAQLKVIEAMRAANEKDLAAKEWFKANYEAKLMDAFGKVMAAVEPCKTDKAVLAAVKSIGPTKKDVKEAAPK